MSRDPQRGMVLERKAVDFAQRTSMQEECEISAKSNVQSIVKYMFLSEFHKKARNGALRAKSMRIHVTVKGGRFACATPWTSLQCETQ